MIRFLPLISDMLPVFFYEITFITQLIFNNPLRVLCSLFFLPGWDMCSAVAVVMLCHWEVVSANDVFASRPFVKQYGARHCLCEA